MSRGRAVTRIITGTVVTAALAAGLARCGNGGDGDALVVSAAASLSAALPSYAETAGFEDARFSFAGSDELAAQIRQGATPDVYAAANTALPEELHADGLLEAPVAFASNRLVLAVPAQSDAVRSLADLREPEVRIAIGDEDVPVGIYTHEVLNRLGAAQSEAILANARSTEPDVLGIVGKLTQGAVDAGFVYRSDVRAAGDRLRAIGLPRRLRADVTYGAGVVTGGERPGDAERFVAELRSAEGQEALRAAGLLPPP